MFQLKDSTVHVENPSYSLKLVENGKFFNLFHVHTDFLKGQEFAAWSPALEKSVVDAVEDAEYGDTYEAKYVGFNPAYDRSIDGSRVFSVYNINNDSGEEQFIGKVRVDNITEKYQEAVEELKEVAQTATHPDDFENVFEELLARTRHLAVLDANVDGIEVATSDALDGSGWELFWESGMYQFRRVLAPLAERISIVNAKFVADDGVHIAFDVALDGKVVCSTLEWLDGDLNLVREECHIDANPDHESAVARALGDDADEYDERSEDCRRGLLGDIHDIVWRKLVDAHAALKASMLPELEDWWYIATPHAIGDGMYAWGSEAQAAAYCDLLDKRKNDEFGLYFHKPVSLVEALTLLRNKEGFDLDDAIAELKAAEEAA
ncbi:hypothetical protein AB3G45_24345 [Shinella sp. S4-D37]|uniref:hypothetical protein n=1 Tax=Shinella sp. S4-D37 TaxID=3161999 RepID=UPI003465AFA9